MPKKLVIVESPAKARTIKGFLGADYDVQASIGHIRDLAENKSALPKEMQKEWWADYSVDIDNDFDVKYVVPKEKTEQVRKLKKALQEADTLVLATDEDREGESISWHLLEVLKPKKGTVVQRIAFHEITKEAIQNALKNPRKIDDNLVRAQEARRVLDRLYGYTLSPVLWRLGKGRGLSAGRVQTPAVKLIVEREFERRRFRSASYWDLKALLSAEGGSLEAGLIEVDGKKIASGKEDFDASTGELKGNKLLLDEKAAKGLADRASKAKPWTVVSVEQHPEQRRPYPPFMTSSLQQEANRKLGFSADRTMRVAQDLYEGIAGIGIEGGLITYMRTDSVNLSETAVTQARGLISARYGAEYLPAKPNRYTSKVNNAQEAHEAIRPTDVELTPESVAKALGKDSKFSDHIKLYELVWKRTVASQMKAAELLMTSARINAPTEGKGLTFSASGKQIKFPGFLRAYVEGSDDPDAALEDQEKLLPALAEGQTLEVSKVDALGHETKPPARYTDASLVKALEDRGIGRPSTYAAIIRTIVDREYVRKKGKELIPTFMAFLVTDVMDSHFGEFSDLNFTAQMDRELDEIANGKENWKRYLKEFFIGGDTEPGLKKLVEERQKNIKRPVFDVGDGISVQFGRNGFFLVQGDVETGRTASVPEDIAPADLTPAMAEELFEKKAAGPESIGTDPVTGRRLLVKNRGGFYLEAERTKEEVEAKEKPRWISVPPGINPADLAVEELNALCYLPKSLGTHEGAEVFAKMGKYGGYVEMGVERRTIEDWRKLLTITMEEALPILAEPKVGGRGAGAAKASALKEFGPLEGSEGPVKLMAGRYGPYVTDGTTNATLPKGATPEDFTAEQATELLKAKREAGPTPKRKFVKKRK